MQNCSRIFTNLILIYCHARMCLFKGQLLSILMTHTVSHIPNKGRAWIIWARMEGHISSLYALSNTIRLCDTLGMNVVSKRKEARRNDVVHHISQGSHAPRTASVTWLHEQCKNFLEYEKLPSLLPPWIIQIHNKQHHSATVWRWQCHGRLSLLQSCSWKGYSRNGRRSISQPH